MDVKEQKDANACVRDCACALQYRRPFDMCKPLIVPCLFRDRRRYLLELLDKLETQLRASGNPDFVNRCVAGTNVTRFECSAACGSVRYKEEPFVTLALHVKNQRNLQSSFGEYMQADTITGYFCEACGRVEEQRKRVMLSTLPPTLFLALSRFEFNQACLVWCKCDVMNHFCVCVFNQDSGTLEKVNSAFEFPARLSMLPFTREGALGDVPRRGEAYYEYVPVRAVREWIARVGRPFRYTRNPHASRDRRYDLVGVVVHSGTANSGHYISLIRERDGGVGDDGGSGGGGGGSGGEGTSDGARWYHFEDGLVAPYDVRDLEAECFGGVQVRVAAVFVTVHSVNSARSNDRVLMRMGAGAL